MTTNYEQIRRRRNLPEDVQRVAFADALSKLPLAALRAAAELTQSAMAERLQISQAAVSQMEGRGDFLFSTLQRYADAVDGVLDVVVKVKNKCFRLEHDRGEDGSFFSLEPCVDIPELRVWGAAVGRVQNASAPKTNDLWARRPVSVEDIDVTRAFVASANQTEFAQVA